jgi:hypothetical protein
MERARRWPRRRPRAKSKGRVVFRVTHSGRPMINALWAAVMACAGALWCGGDAAERSKSFGPDLF